MSLNTIVTVPPSCARADGSRGDLSTWRTMTSMDVAVGSKSETGAAGRPSWAIASMVVPPTVSGRPGISTTGTVMRSPFRNVPLVLPRSVATTPVGVRASWT